MRSTFTKRRTPSGSYKFSRLRRATVKKNSGFLDGFIRWSWIVLGVFSVLQLIFFWNLANAVGVGCVVVAWKIVSRFFLREKVLHTWPLSAFLVIGFVTTQFYFPLVFTLMEGKPIIFNMDLPFEVFIHSTAGLFILVLAHFIYRASSKYSRKRSGSIMVGAGFFYPPSDRQVWIMGLTGLAAMYYVHFYSPSEGREVAGVGDKFIQGLIVFSYAPYFIPLCRLYGKKKVNMKLMIPLLILFTVLLFLVSLGRNSRGAFMLGFTAVGFAYGLGLLLGVYKTRLLTVRNVAFAALGLWFLTGPLADLATAMVIVRAHRNETDRSELVRLTLEAYKDKETLQRYKLAGISQEREWDEQYMDNLFLARFSNLKYNDASLVEASKISELDPDMLQYTIDRFWATLPQPAISFLGLDVDKGTVTTYSFGDFLHYKAGAGPGALGGFRTGHFAGTGIAAFGWWYLMILGIGVVPVYFLFDKLFIRKLSVKASPGERSELKPQFSFCGLLSLSTVFMFLPAESVVEPFVFLTRGFIQMFLLYFLIFHITRWLSFLLPRVIIKSPVKRPRYISR